MAELKKSAFDILNAIDVNEHTEVKDTGSTKLKYLSWAWAWSEVKKKFPDAIYEIIKFNGIPYVYDPLTGYMVYTTVTIQGITHEMWLPVMDGQNRAMKAEPYQVQTKYKTLTVPAATMFDINKTIMRCLTKNLAMFGLGLYIYAGEDIPEDSEEVAAAPKATTTPAVIKTPEAVKKAAQPEAQAQRSPARQKLADYCKEAGLTVEEQHEIVRQCGLSKTSTEQDYERAYLVAVNMKMEKDKASEPSGQLPFEV